jgi:methionyl-tRNA formyltransferase
MKVIILTSLPFGTASYCLPRLVRRPGIEIAMVVYNVGKTANFRLRLRRIRKLGLLGSLIALRLRNWFKKDAVGNLGTTRIDKLALELGVRLERTPTINCQRTVDLFREANADIGVSLGNGYIEERVFSLPKYGMINIHHDILPQFRGSQSIIWNIYEGLLETGYTIHQIERRIDAGKMIYQEKMPIELRPTLRLTVAHNYARLIERSVHGLLMVLGAYLEFAARAVPQGPGRTLRPPTLLQYLKMVRQHRKLYQQQVRGKQK